MEYKKNIFFKKKILIYGLGKSGISTYYFLRKNNDLYLYDDNINVIKGKKIKKIITKKTKNKNETLPPVPTVEKRKKDIGLSEPQVENN